MQLLVTAQKVLLGPEGQCIDDGAVVIEGEYVRAVGPRTEIESLCPPEVHRRDYPSCTILPGLINSHVHLALDTSATPIDNLLATGDVELFHGMASRAKQALSGGVTTVRDLGDRGGLAIQLGEAISRGEIVGPRIFSSGSPLTVPQGHCWFFGGEVSGEAAIRKKIRYNAELGADVIKVMASGGQITPNSPPMYESQFTADELCVVVDEAGKAGLPVAAHAHGTEAIVNAVAAGVTTIEHCTWMRSGGNGVDWRHDVASDMAERGIYACTTWPPRWREFMDFLGPERSQLMIDRVRWLDELGVQLITGTDAGLARSVFDDFVGAIELYEHIGFARSRIIEMATVRSAQALGRGHLIGRIDRGYGADLLVVDGNPLDELSALRARRLVLSRGKVVSEK